MLGKQVVPADQFLQITHQVFNFYLDKYLYMLYKFNYETTLANKFCLIMHVGLFNKLVGNIVL